VKKISFLNKFIFLILIISCTNICTAYGVIERTAVIVTDKPSVTITLNTDFTDIGVVDDKYLMEESFPTQINIPVNSIYEKTFKLTTYSGEKIPDDLVAGDYFDEVVLEDEYEINYKVQVYDFKIVYDSYTATDNKIAALYDKSGGWLRLTASPQGISPSVFKWFYGYEGNEENLGTGIMKSPMFYTGKNVFSLKVSEPEYSKAVRTLNGNVYNGTSKSTHYMVLDNPNVYTIPSMGNYNFEILYDDGSLINSGYEKIVSGTEVISVSNRDFLVHKPEFKLQLKFVDQTNKLGGNRNKLTYSWSVIDGNGIINNSTYTNIGGKFSNDETVIELSIKSDGHQLTPCRLTIHPYKPVVNFNSSIDMEPAKTLRITSIRDLRWENVSESEYNPSNMKNYKNTGTLLKLVDSALGTDKNPKMGYGVFLKLNTINEILGKPLQVKVDMILEDEPRDVIKNDVLEDKFKTIKISRFDSGKIVDFVEERKDVQGGSEWSFMYYLPGKKDKSVGDEVNVYVDEITIIYPDGEVKYSDWFNKKIHIFTYDNTIDTIDDIEGFLTY